MRSSSVNLGRLFSNLSKNEVPLVEDPVVGLVSFTSLSMNEPFIFFLELFLVSLSLLKSFIVFFELAYNLSTFGIFRSLRSYNGLLLFPSGLTLRLNLDNSLDCFGLRSLFFFGFESVVIFSSLNNWHSIDGTIFAGYKVSNDTIILSTIGQSTGKKSLQIS